MKSKVSSILAVVLLVASSFFATTDAMAQARPSSKTSILSVEPFGLLGIGNFRSIQLQYEWKASQDNSWALRAAFLPTYVNVSGFGFGASYRFYLLESRAITGFNLSPGIDMFLLSFGEANYTSFGVGGDVAYKWIFDNFGVEPFIRYRQLFTGSESSSNYSGASLDVGVYLGYAW